MPDCDLAFICESPGYRELEWGRPLVGPAGKLFDKILAAVNLDRSQTSLINTIGCCDLDREDRRPLPNEIEACRPRLLDDIVQANARVYLAMGNISQQLFFPGTRVGQIRGRIRNFQGRLVIPTYHPAAALPHRSPDLAPVITEDIRTAVDLAKEMQILPRLASRS